MALSAEDQAWSDAYYIAYVGASNPRAVAITMAGAVGKLGASHPAVRAMAGHLAFLRGESLGASIKDLSAVRANARRLGIIDDAGKYIGKQTTRES